MTNTDYKLENAVDTDFNANSDPEQYTRYA